MDPNSRHQLWSKWIITIRPRVPFAPAFQEVKAHTARFMRHGFGSAAMCRIRQFPKAWVVEVLADRERHPHDQADFAYMRDSVIQFFRNGFGPSTDVYVKARLMAGARLDGGAPDQMLIMPATRLM